MDTRDALTEAPEKGIRVQCNNCGRKWNYRGRRKHYAPCPGCHTSVRIRTGEAVKR